VGLCDLANGWSRREPTGRLAAVFGVISLLVAQCRRHAVVVLLAQAYEHARTCCRSCGVGCVLLKAGIEPSQRRTGNDRCLLIQIDKLVQLLESTVFTCGSLLLITRVSDLPSPPAATPRTRQYPYLLKALYGL